MQVAIVVDPDYVGLSELTGRMLVWLVSSPENIARASKFWTQSASDVLDQLTTFKVVSLDEREDNCLYTIESVELHHPEMNELS